MRMISFIFSLIIISASAAGQKPKDGTYAYSLVFDEWGENVLESTCTVYIKGDSVYVLHDGNKGLTGKKGSVIAKGILVQHKATGYWLVARSKADRFAKEIGGCGDGPTRIDFRRKKFWTC